MRSVTIMAASSALRVVMSMVAHWPAGLGQPGGGVGVEDRLGLGGAGLALEPAVPAPGGQPGRDYRRAAVEDDGQGGLVGALVELEDDVPADARPCAAGPGWREGSGRR